MLHKDPNHDFISALFGIGGVRMGVSVSNSLKDVIVHLHEITPLPREDREDVDKVAAATQTNCAGIALVFKTVESLDSFQRVLDDARKHLVDVQNGGTFETFEAQLTAAVSKKAAKDIEVQAVRGEV